MTLPRIPALALLLFTPLVGAAPVRGEETLGGTDLSEALETLRAELELPGLVALAYQEGEVLAWGAAGVRVVGGEEALTIHDPVHLGSCTKAMTAALVARLVEQEVLSWETTLADALPELAEKVDPVFGATTPLTFLRHRAGIAERRRPELGLFFPIMAEMEGTGPEVRARILEKILALPPRLPDPGGYDYSNYGYMTVGLMLQGITGRSWEELIVSELFEPMGLASAGVGSPAGEGVPVGHVPDDDGWRALPPGPGGFLPDAMAPAGLAHMNLLDWSTFVAHQMAGFRGEDHFLAPETYELLLQVPDGGEYAAGWVVSRHAWDWGEGVLLMHNGSDNSWMTLAFVLPEWDLVVLSATNCGGGMAGQGVERAKLLLLEALEY